MKILYLGIAVWPTWERAKQITWLFMKCANLRGYPFKYYGVGTEAFPGYKGQKVDLQLAWLLDKANWYTKGYTHLLYTDCCDVLLFGSPQEIEEKYAGMGKPQMLVAAADHLGNACDENKVTNPKYRGYFPNHHYGYPQVGGYIAEIPYWIDTMQRFLKEFPDYGDDCFMWYDGWVGGWFRPELDHGCEIFQVKSMEDTEVVEKDGQLRLHNMVTDSYPCVFHEAGGYFDPETGKDHFMLPIAEKVGLI